MYMIAVPRLHSSGIKTCSNLNALNRRRLNAAGVEISFSTALKAASLQHLAKGEFFSLSKHSSKLL
jgi:hypothetical protein